MSQKWPKKSLGEVLIKTETIDPTKSPSKYFEYVDVSSVSNRTLAIEETQRIIGKDAPSRARKLIKSGDVLFATIRPTLKRLAIVQDELDGQVCSTGYFVLRPKSELNNRFLFYFLQSEQFLAAMEERQKGASYPAVTDGDVRDQEISLPPLPEQKRIVAILDEAFAGLAVAKANAERNLENARELFEGYRESILTDEKNGWIKKRFSEICEIKHGYAFEGKYFKSSGEYVLLTPGNFFERGGYRDRGDKQKYFTGTIPRDYVLNKGDLLVAMTEQAAGLLGSPILVPESNKYLHNQRLGLVKKNLNSPWLNEFFFHVFNTNYVRKAIHASASGVKVRHTSPSKIGDIEISFPPSVNEQKEIILTLNRLEIETQNFVHTLQKKYLTLRTLESSILAQEFSH